MSSSSSNEPNSKRQRTERLPDVYVKLKGQPPAPYSARTESTVAHILVKVRKMENIRVGAAKLSMYLNEAQLLTEQNPLPRDQKIRDIQGNTFANPFVVDYVDPLTSGDVMELLTSIESKQDSMAQVQGAMAQVQGAMAEAFTNLGKIRPVTESAAATETRGTDWNGKVMEHFQCNRSCVVLAALFPQVPKPRWFGQDPEFRRSQTAFPAVATHIVPKGQIIVGQFWNIDVHAPTNGLPLLRHLERTFQAGLWTMIPTGYRNFKLFVSDALKDVEIKYYGSVGEPEHGVQKENGEPLFFRDLHEREITINTTVSYRALYLKAQMAHCVNTELPNPAHHVQEYQESCSQMTGPLWVRLWSSVPDPMLPVVQEVEPVQNYRF